MQRAYQAVVNLVKQNAKHVRGYRLEDVEHSFILQRAESELEELMAEPHDMMELGDLFGCLLHYMVRHGWTFADIEPKILEKFVARFPEATAFIPPQHLPTPKQVNRPWEIPVFHCCGVFGWMIPWGQWCSRNDVLIPATQDQRRPYVYLYSLAGQLEPAGKDRVRPEGSWTTSENFIGSVCIDPYIHSGGAVQWDEVLKDVSVEHRLWRERLSLAIADDDKGTPPDLR